MAGLNVSRRLWVSDAASIGTPVGQQLVGEAEQQQLAVGQVGLLDVDAPVRHDAAGDLDRPGALGPPGQELAPDGVAHVVGQAAPAGRGRARRRRRWRRRPGAPWCSCGRACPTGRSRACRRGAHGAPAAGRRGRRRSRTTRSGSRAARAAGRASSGPMAGTSTVKIRCAAAVHGVARWPPTRCSVAIVTCRPACSRPGPASPRRPIRSTSTRSRTRRGATRAPRPSRRACRSGPAGRAARPPGRCPKAGAICPARPAASSVIMTKPISELSSRSSKRSPGRFLHPRHLRAGALGRGVARPSRHRRCPRAGSR